MHLVTILRNGSTNQVDLVFRIAATNAEQDFTKFNQSRIRHRFSRPFIDILTNFGRN